MNNKRKITLTAYIPFLAVTALAVLGIINIKWLLGVLGGLWNIISPLVTGCIMAYILNLVMRKLECVFLPNSNKTAVKKMRRPVCLIISLMLILIIAALIIGLIIPEIINIFVVLGETIPVYAEKIRTFLIKYEEQVPVVGEYIADYLQNDSIDWNNILQKIMDFAKNGVSGLLGTTVSIISSVVGGIVNFFIGLIFAIYILFNKERLAEGTLKLMKSYMKPAGADRISYFCRTADRCFSSFIVGQCTEAVILGVLCALGMAILQLPYATTIGTLVGATALVPIVGAYIGAIVGALMILVVDPIKALWFIVFLVILQQIEGNVIYPKVVGSSIGLPGMWVLAAVTVGGGLGGIPGMLIGVPAAATVYKLVENDVRKRLGENDDNTVTEAAAEDIMSSDDNADNEEPQDTEQPQAADNDAESTAETDDSEK